MPNLFRDLTVEKEMVSNLKVETVEISNSFMLFYM